MEKMISESYSAHIPASPLIEVYLMEVNKDGSTFSMFYCTQFLINCII